MFKITANKHFLPLCKILKLCYSLKNRTIEQCRNEFLSNFEVYCELKKLHFCSFLGISIDTFWAFQDTTVHERTKKIYNCH